MKCNIIYYALLKSSNEPIKQTLKGRTRNLKHTKSSSAFVINYNSIILYKQ